MTITTTPRHLATSTARQLIYANSSPGLTRAQSSSRRDLRESAKVVASMLRSCWMLRRALRSCRTRQDGRILQKVCHLPYNFSDDTDKTDPGAVELVKELDGLPLALSTAGAYLEHVSMTLSDYLRLYKASWLKLQTTSPQLESYEDRSLYTTWQITFDRIQQQNPASASLLKLWAYFDRQDVWFELLRHANSPDD